MGRSVLTLVALIALPLGAHAQPTEPILVASGFVPDPMVRIGSTGGARPLRDLAPSCAGFVADLPSQRLRIATRISFLRLFVLAPRPVTLAVHAPDGRWTCAQQRRQRDGAPSIEDTFVPGIYEVWVGSAEAEQQTAYELHITEFHSWTAGSRGPDRSNMMAGRDLGLDEAVEVGRNQGRRLQRGFLPDPREDGGETGGAVDVGHLGPGCRGYVTAIPNHVLVLRDEFDYFRIQLGAADGVSSLVVRTPSGEYRCDRASELSPALANEAWPPGDYLIWVASARPDTETSYRICYTEMRPSGVNTCGTRPVAVP